MATISGNIIGTGTSSSSLYFAGEDDPETLETDEAFTLSYPLSFGPFSYSIDTKGPKGGAINPYYRIRASDGEQIVEVHGDLSIIPGSHLPDAAFSASPNEGAVPLSVDFTDESTGTGITEWKWDFGDGNITTVTNPADKNQNHVYSSVPLYGYDVSLTVTNSVGNNTKTLYTYIRPRQLPVANISGSPTTGDAPHLVQFHDDSEGIGLKAWEWTFGDGGTSTERDPVHVYYTAGNYQASCTVTDAYNEEADSQNLPVTILSPPSTPSSPPALTPESWLGFVDFNVSPTNGSYPLMVMFNDTSSGPDISSYQWLLSDDTGTIFSDKNFTHVFENPGIYHVNHSVLSSAGKFWNNKTGCILVGTSATPPRGHYRHYSGNRA